ncbi:hypothetical protein PYCC9005_005858 [Savitreella phatthalungensis]
MPSSSHFHAPRAVNPTRQHDMSSYMSSSPLARSQVDLSDVTHEYEPDVDGDGYRHPGNHHAEGHGDWTPSLLGTRPTSKHAHPLRPPSNRSRPSFTSERSEMTFEYDPDVDADGVRHHHDRASSPVQPRKLPEAVVPLDPRAGRIIITPSPSYRLHPSPYKNLDKIPTKSIEDFRDPEELHSHAQMIYGIDESKAKKDGVPGWMDGEALDFIQRVSKAEPVDQVSNRPVDTKLPIEPTGETFAPLGNFAGDHKPVPPTRPMKTEERPGIEGAYTKDGEGSAGLPFDENSESRDGTKKTLEVGQEGTVHGVEDLTASTETVRAAQIRTLADHIAQPEKRTADAPAPVQDWESSDARPAWLRAAELMANNEYAKLASAGLVTDKRASDEGVDHASAARATLLRDGKLSLERGTSYPSLAEMERARGNDADDDVPPRSAIPTGNVPASERDLHLQNPPTNSAAREEKFAAESPTTSFKPKDDVEPSMAEKFLGGSAVAAAGAAIPAAALMTSARDQKADTSGEIHMQEQVKPQAAPAVPRRPGSTTQPAVNTPAVPRRPQKQDPQQELTSSKEAETSARQVDDTTQARPIAAPKPIVPARPQPGKLTGAKSAFASALEAKLRSGPQLPPKKQIVQEESASTEPEEPKQLEDARKGRARGPARRRAAQKDESGLQEEAEKDKVQEATSTGSALTIGPLMTSRFGVEMRSMGIQTGSVPVSVSTGESMTVLRGASVEHEGDVVVDHKGPPADSTTAPTHSGDLPASKPTPPEADLEARDTFESSPAVPAPPAEPEIEVEP